MVLIFVDLRSRIFSLDGGDVDRLQFVAMKRHPALGLLRRDEGEEGGDLAMGGEAQALKRRPAGPVDEFGMADFSLAI